MTDFLTEKRTEIEQRLQELRPLFDEYTRLERARAALEGVDEGNADGDGRRRRGAGGGPGGRRRPANGRRRRGPSPGRTRRTGGRAGEALELVRQNPGITVAEVADRLGMKQRNYLYRIMANLQSEGAVEKQGRGFAAR
jgi:Winged helix-turn-helix DNA-binding